MKLVKKLILIPLAFIFVLQASATVSPKGYPDYDDDDYGFQSTYSLDDFVEWVKSGGNFEDKEKELLTFGSLKYPRNQRFIEALEEVDALAIPVIKNDNFRLI